jgi:hypothetical protein
MFVIIVFSVGLLGTATSIYRSITGEFVNTGEVNNVHTNKEENDGVTEIDFRVDLDSGVDQLKKIKVTTTSDTKLFIPTNSLGEFESFLAARTTKS